MLKVIFLNGYTSWIGAGFSFPTEASEQLDYTQKEFEFGSLFPENSKPRSRSPSPTRPISQPPSSNYLPPSPPSSPPSRSLSPPQRPQQQSQLHLHHNQHQHQHHHYQTALKPHANHSHPFHPTTSHTHSTIINNEASQNDVKHHPSRIPDGFQIVLENLRNFTERRTTLMIRNIPNKYTQEMFLDFINETHKGKYDFIYLPIDFKNKCNVGYAFINFLDPISIISLYTRIQGKKWTRFNSEKICAVSFARIQGKEHLIKHFQNSTIMTETSDYRPKIFFSSGPLIGQEEEFPEPNVSYVSSEGVPKGYYSNPSKKAEFDKIQFSSMGMIKKIPEAMAC